MKTLLSTCVFTLIFTLCFSTAVFCQTSESEEKDISHIKISNFGQMDDRFYRGAQPKKRDFKSLAELGVNTVINLRNDPKDFEKETVEALGMKYVHIPMSDKKYPKNESIEKFLEIVNDSETGVFFVHCRGGKHRTGATGAVYRFTEYGWDYDQAYAEMKKFNFYTFLWFYKPIKRFVKDYAEKMETAKKEESEIDESIAETNR